MEKTEFERIENLIMRKADGCWISCRDPIMVEIYPFTTENIAGYIEKFNLKNKSLLTVGSSGDQVINAALYDCTDITLLDINPFTKFYVYLKIACLLELNRSKFMKFLRYNDFPITFKKNYDCFNKNVYRRVGKVLEMLDKESFLIWEKLFDSFKPLEIRNNLFSLDEYNNRAIKAINPYLVSDEAYEKTRAKIQRADIKFLTGDVLDVELNGKYDNIWLSNLCQYIDDFKKIKLLVDKMVGYLTDEGQLLISYLYKTESLESVDDSRPIYELDKVLELLKEYSLSFSTFKGIDRILDLFGGGHNDAILYYKKK